MGALKSSVIERFWRYRWVGRVSRFLSSSHSRPQLLWLMLPLFVSSYDRFRRFYRFLFILDQRGLQRLFLFRKRIRIYLPHRGRVHTTAGQYFRQFQRFFLTILLVPIVSKKLKLGLYRRGFNVVLRLPHKLLPVSPWGRVHRGFALKSRGWYLFIPSIFRFQES